MATSPISSVMTSTTNVTTSSASAQANVDNDDFMTLLLAQLKNQDPLNPMDSSQMMGQIAQLNSLNALLAMQKSIDSMNQSQTKTPTFELGFSVNQALRFIGDRTVLHHHR